MLRGCLTVLQKEMQKLVTEVRDDFAWEAPEHTFPGDFLPVELWNYRILDPKYNNPMD